jgi:hypothetical protein
MSRRSTDEIRNTIEANRSALELSVVRLRGEVAELTDWRHQVVRHRREVLAGAAVAGFLLGGLLIPRRRRR